MISAALPDAPPANERTPCRVYLPDVARERIERVARLRDVLGRPPLALVSAFSVKTNPRAELLATARACGYRAEVISADELRWARRLGFDAGAIVYNGPEPLLAAEGGEQVGLIFADSVEAFARNAGRGVALVGGARLRPSMLDSRFGVPVDDDDALAAAVARTPPAAPFAVSFHARRGDFHGASWRDVAADVLERAIALQSRTGRPIVAFDVGGGWTPEEFDAEFERDVRWLVGRIVAELPTARELIFEPGQAVCTPAEALVTRVVELRERRARREAILDAGYPEWPQMHSYVHAIFAWRDGGWRALGRGPDRLGGRTCLEYDVIDGVRFPPDLAEGDVLLIAGTGSYDRSMAFDFARGGA
ncbi:MAG TPA: hypothetical protein VHT53_10385 [Candidatus Elarobacter sp.]|jgi:diaminopimelate decarboxylase|nr:hypothetical protein [Candidatus Elarobacter sp.]